VTLFSQPENTFRHSSRAAELKGRSAASCDTMNCNVAATVCEKEKADYFFIIKKKLLTHDSSLP
jgi:hypothetical protein